MCLTANLVRFSVGSFYWLLIFVLLFWWEIFYFHFMDGAVFFDVELVEGTVVELEHIIEYFFI